MDVIQKFKFINLYVNPILYSDSIDIQRTNVIINTYYTKHIPHTIEIDIYCPYKSKIILSINDARNMVCKYTSRELYFIGKRKIIIPMPITPYEILISIFETNGIPFQYKITYKKVIKKPKDFLYPKNFFEFYNLITQFSQVKELLPTGKYKSDDGNFEIIYLDNVTKNVNGKEIPSTSPAAVYQLTGKIEIGKKRIINFSVFETIAILFHEYSHVYVNPLMGYEMSDEFMADMNALQLFLSLGYKGYDFLISFLKVFEMANNEFNESRYNAMKKFIEKVENKLGTEDKVVF